MMPDKTFSIAPMMDYTDRHERYFLRLLSKNMWLYTEMVTTQGILHGNQSKLLGFNECEHPVALQLGGSDPVELAKCAKIGEEWSYDEINLNVGCPSDRVKSGQFGACLMANPNLVAECISAMRAKVSIPVTVKCRIGIDDQEDYLDLVNFISKIAEVGCNDFIIHARKAWLQGLSPKENREIPPLRYELVYQLKRDFPNLFITINGGIKSLLEAEVHLQHVDGVMLGRAAYNNPYQLSQVDRKFYANGTEIPSRSQILSQFLDYMDDQLAEGTPLTLMSRHILGLFQGLPGAKAWRRHISENAHKPGVGTDLIKDAAKFVQISV